MSILEKTIHIIFDHDGTIVNTCVLPRYVFQGLTTLLQKLYDLNIPMYVWTARSKESAITSLEEQNILHFFQDVCGGQTTAPKPSPEGIEYLVPEASAENVIVIGDSIGDIIGGKMFGAFTIGALWSHGSSEYAQSFYDEGADLCVQTVDELTDFLMNRIEVKNV